MYFSFFRNSDRDGMVRATLALGLLATLFTSNVSAAAELIIESWRNDDVQIWQDKILPEFEKLHPAIKVTFSPTLQTEYDSALSSKLAGGAAGDLITCRPFDGSLALFNRGALVALNDLSGMSSFGPVATAPFSTDDGTQTFCVPMASVLHGFIYNKKVFDELDLQVPKTEDEFFALLDKIKSDGRYVPLAMGTKDQWPSAMLAYQNIGASFWKGEEGRRGLIEGTEKLTDPQWVKPLELIARWKPYLADGFEAQGYADTQTLFGLGRAAVYPAGSWDINALQGQVDFELGAFPPPLPTASENCVIIDHPDIGLGLNAAAKEPEAARTFLTWVASPEFARLYTNALPGFFSLSETPVTLDNPLAQEFVSWRESCASTIRPAYQILSRGNPNLENELWRVTTNVINGTQAPQAGAEELQKGLESWYKPQQ